MTPQELQQKINERVKFKLLSMPVEFELDVEWYRHALIVLRKVSLLALGITAKEYAEIVMMLEDKEPMNCFWFACINNELQNCTANDLKIDDLLIYAGKMQQVEDLAIAWNNQIGDLRAKISEECIQEYNVLNKNDKLRISH